MDIFLGVVIFCLLIVIFYQEDTIKEIHRNMSSISDNCIHYSSKCHDLKNENSELRKRLGIHDETKNMDREYKLTYDEEFKIWVVIDNNSINCESSILCVLNEDITDWSLNMMVDGLMTIGVDVSEYEFSGDYK